MLKPRESLRDLPYLDNNNKDTKFRLKLDCNENIYGVSNFVLSAVKNIEEKDIALFPNYDKCIDKLCVRFDIAKDNLFFACDNYDAVNKILNTYMEQDDEFLSFEFISNVIINNLKNLNAKIKIAKYNETFTFEKDEFTKNITNKTKVIYLSTPNSITGYLIKASMIEVIIKEYPEILFIIDCSYINFANNSVIEDFIDLTKKYDNLAIIESYSAGYALAGLKFALIAGDGSIINNIKKIAVSNVNSVALISVIAYENDKNKIEEIKEINNKNKELLFSGLKALGFKPYESEANFLLCDFHNYSDFYYRKFKNNGIVVKKFKKDSCFSSCLRITIPKEGGVKYILELLKAKKVLVFNPDNIIFNISNSYYPAIAKTIEILTNEKVSNEKILHVKNLGSLKSNYDLIKKITFELGYEIDNNEILNVFNKIIFSNDESQKKYIDNTSLILSCELLERLNKEYDLVLAANYNAEEINYILEKLNIAEMFSYTASNKELFSGNVLIDDSSNLSEILKCCPYRTIKFFGSSVDDIILGNSLNVDTIGVFADEDNNVMKNNFKHLGAKYILNNVQNLENFLKDIEE